MDISDFKKNKMRINLFFYAGVLIAFVKRICAYSQGNHVRVMLVQVGEIVNPFVNQLGVDSFHISIQMIEIGILYIA